MFGIKNKVGLTSSSLPSEVIERLRSEEDLLAAFPSDSDCAFRDIDEHEIDDVMNIQPVEEVPASPLVLTSVYPGPHKTLTEVPELTPARNPLAETVLDTDTMGGARVSQCPQAEHMIKRQHLQLPSVNKGDTIPKVDRGRGDPRNIVGLLLDHNIVTDLYLIAIKAGVLKDNYS